MILLRLPYVWPFLGPFNCNKWLAEHLEELMVQYPGDTEAGIYQRIREANLEPMPLVFRVPCEEDLQSILFAGKGGHL